MELVNDFTVNVPVDEAWTHAHRRRAHRAVPARRAAPGDRGRRLPRRRQGEGRSDHGPVQGPGDASSSATTSNHRAVLKAEGRDTGGKGNASALITAQLDAGRRRHDQGHGHHRPHHHRQGRPVRPRRAGRRQRQAAAASSSTSLETTVLPPDGTASAAGGRRPPRPRPHPSPREPATGARANGDPAVPQGRARPAPIPSTRPSAREIERRRAEPIDLLEPPAAPMRQAAASLIGGRRRWCCCRCCAGRPTPAWSRRRRPGAPSQSCSGATPRATSRWSCATSTGRRS